MKIEAALQADKWSPRRAFPPSVMLAPKLFTCSTGLYLRTNSQQGDGDPVYAVGWAESDYWALRAWEYPQFKGDSIAPPPMWANRPSLRELGKPRDLRFATVLEFESRQQGARKATLLLARFRVTDGFFLSSDVKGTRGVTYLYDSPEPSPLDLPVALEIRLQPRSP